MATVACPGARGVRRDGVVGLGLGLAVVVVGVVLVGVRHGSRPQGSPEGWFSAFGFAAAFIATGLVAVMGWVRRAAWLWWASGLALFPLAIASALIPLVAAAAYLFVLGWRYPSHGYDRLCGTLIALVLVASFGAVAVRKDPEQWAGGSSGDVITSAEASLSAVLAVIAIVASGVLSRGAGSRRAPRAGRQNLCLTGSLHRRRGRAIT